MTSSVAARPLAVATSPPHPARRRLLVAAIAVEATSALANAYCITHHLPARLGSHAAAADVGHDWLANGTAIGPPLAPMVLLALTFLAIGVQRWWGRLATGMAGLVAAALLVGTVGEPTTRSVFTPGGFNAAQAGLRIAMIVTAFALGSLVVRDLIARHHDLCS